MNTSATQQAAQFGNPYTPASYDICRNIVNVGVHVLRNCCICMEKNLVQFLGLNFILPARKRKLFLLSDALAD